LGGVTIGKIKDQSQSGQKVQETQKAGFFGTPPSYAGSLNREIVGLPRHKNETLFKK
jgi:hypothetical protein